MQDQLKIIRKFFDSISVPYEALSAFEQIEAMAGGQEPVHWRAVLDPEQVPQQLKATMHVVGFREKKAAEGFVAEQIDFYGWRYTIEPLYAAPVAQQPQAEAVPQAAEFCWLVEHFDGDGTSNSTGHYYTGKIGIADRVLTTMDANEAKRYDTWREANLASVKLGSTLTGTWRAVQHGFHTIPQQAEAVPLFAALKVEGPRFHCAKVYGRIYQVLAVGSNKEDLLTVARLAKDAYYKQFPGTHEYKEPPFEWVVEEVPTAQPKFQPTEAVPPGYVQVPVKPSREIEAAIARARNLKASEIWECAIDAAIAQQKD